MQRSAFGTVLGEEEEEEEEAQEEEEGGTQASSAMDGTRMSTRYQPVHAEL